MPYLSLVLKNPIAVLSFLAVVLFGWVAYDLVSSPSAQAVTAKAEPEADHGPKRFHPKIQAALRRQQTLHALEEISKLKPGMSRAEVESVIGPPLANGVQPVTQTDGRLTYWGSYTLLRPDPAAPDHSDAGPKKAPEKNMASKPQISIQYDASKPGHPLLDIRYQDPLF